MSAPRLSPEELIELASNNENRVGDVLPSAGAIRHFLYVTLLRPDVLGRLLTSSISREVARNRIQRYIREEFENILGAAGDRFNAQSTRQLYDEFMGVLERRIQRLKERKRAEGKNSKASTSGRQQSVRPPARRAVRPAQGRAPRPAVAPAAAAVAQNRRRRASTSPQNSDDSAPHSNGVDANDFALMFGDMNIDRPAPAVAPAAPRRVVRARRVAPAVTIVVPIRQSTRVRTTPAQAASAERRRLATEQERAARAVAERAENRETAREAARALEDLFRNARL